MAQLDDLKKGDLPGGAAIVVAAAVLIPVAAVALAPYWRPAARSALKWGILALEKAREVGAEFTELVEDVAAEVQEELRASRTQATDTMTQPEPQASGVAAGSAQRAA